MQTRDIYLKEAEMELGEQVFRDLRHSIDNEYYESIVTYAKAGVPISKAIYENLSDGQRYHFNKHYNYRGELVEE